MRSATGNNTLKQALAGFAAAAVLIILTARVISLVNLRLDLTEDKRYTLSEPTRKILSDLRNDVFIQVYLDGEIPIPLKRLKRSVKELLDEFRVASGRKVDYEFINPSSETNKTKRDVLYQSLVNKGLAPVNLQAGDEEGGSTRKIIFPGMLVNYNGTEVPVNFLNNSSGSYEENILRSMEGLEYEVIQTVATLTADSVYKVAFIEGHGEIPEIETADITLDLARYFTVDRGIPGGRTGILDSYAAIIVAGPENEIPEADKLVIDQYIMQGGKVLWLIDEVAVNTDSLINGSTVGLYKPVNIEDQLFSYGARINPALVQDIDSWVIRVNISTGNTQQRLVPAPWPYFPLLNPSASHPVTRNLNRVLGRYSSFIDTVGMDAGVKKTVLLATSAQSRILSPPLVISLSETEQEPSVRQYSKSYLPVAVLLEGVFNSPFRNRSISSIHQGSRNTGFLKISKPSKMIVVADADIIRNEVSVRGGRPEPIPLGYDTNTGQTFGNSDFIINCLNYLVDDSGILELRSRELKMRLLDKKKLRDERVFWQLVNILLPVFIVVAAGMIFNYLRKRQFAASL